MYQLIENFEMSGILGTVYVYINLPKMNHMKWKVETNVKHMCWKLKEDPTRKCNYMWTWNKKNEGYE